MNRLLYATNHTEPRYRFLDMLLGLAKVGLQECILVNTAERVIPELYFQEWRWHLSNLNIGVEVVGERGDLTDLILETVGEKDICFVVADFDGTGASSSFRSAIKPLVKWLSIPLLIVNERDAVSSRSRAGVFDRIMFITDWSPASERAAAFLLRLGSLIKRIDIITVVQESLPVRDLREIEERLRETRLLFLSHGSEAEYHIYSGRPIEEIMSAAKDYNASTIVLSARRRSFARTTLTNDLSYGLVGDLSCGMLLVPWFASM